MADENNPAQKPVEATTLVVETPAIVESALGPDTAPLPEVKSEPAAQPEVKVEDKPAEKVEAKTEEVKLEAKAEEKIAAKPEEKKPEVKAEEKTAEVKTEEPKVEPPKFEAFKLPDGVKLEDKQVGEIHSMLGSFEIASKASHEEVQKFGQAIVEYGLGVVKEEVQKIQKSADEYWSKKTKEFREAFEKDPDIGGNRKETTTQAAREFISQHAGSPEKAAEIRKILYDHKLADHPAIIRLLANANLARAEGTPLPAQKATPQKASRYDRWYGNMS